MTAAATAAGSGTSTVELGLLVPWVRTSGSGARCLRRRSGQRFTGFIVVPRDWRRWVTTGEREEPTSTAWVSLDVIRGDL